MAKRYDEDYAKRALLAEVMQEVEKYEQEQFWITDKIAFNMREMIKQFRKNYWGIYDNPKDPVTGQDKLWVPLTQMLVDAVRKGLNFGPKDVRFRSTDVDSVHLTHLIRGFVHRWLSRNYFNHEIDQAVFTAAVDGTQVWKTYVENGQIKTYDVDLLNVYIDPTAESIQEAYRFTERILMTKSEVAAMDGWDNTDQFVTEEDLEKTGDSSAKKQGEFGDVYACYGKFNKCLVKAAQGEFIEDDGKEIEAHIVISGIDTGKTLVHLIEENKETDNLGNIIKPYEELWYVKVPGRWYGKGIAETVLALQEWINTIINLRIKKNTIAQLGLLKVRRGAKVTQQMLQNLVSKGVIELANPEKDLDNLRVDEAGQSSYEDEKVARGWAQDVTAVFDASLGDMPASTSATGAVIQDRQQRSAYQLIAESTEYFVQRWMDRHFLKNIPTMLGSKKNITLFGEFDDIKRVRENVVATMAMKELEGRTKLPSEQEMMDAMRRAERKLEDQKDIFVNVVEDIITAGLETEVFMTNAEIDVAVTVKNLLELRNGLPPEAGNDMTAQALDLLGLQVPQSLKEPVQPQPQEAQAVQAPQQATEQALTTDALTIGNEQR